MNVSAAADGTQGESNVTAPTVPSPEEPLQAGYNLHNPEEVKSGQSSSSEDARSAPPFSEDDPFDASQQLDDFMPSAHGQDFPEVAPTIVDRLRKDRVVFVYGTTSDWKALSDLAYYLVRTSFTDPCRLKAFYSNPRHSVSRQPHKNTFNHLLEWVPKNSTEDTFVVVFDDGPLEHSLLTRSKLHYTLGESFLKDVQERGNLFLLVLTEESRFKQFVNRYHAYLLQHLYHTIDLPKPARSPREVAKELFAAVEEKHKSHGLVSLWCMSWFDLSSMDDLALCIRAVLEAQSTSARQQRKVVDQWRNDWLELLETSQVVVRDNRSVVYLEHSRSDLTAELRSVWRLDQRLRHHGFVEDLRRSGLMQRAGPELLKSFTMFFAYRASLDPSWASEIFIDLLEQWLSGADEARILFVLTSVFNALLFANQFNIATKALRYPPWRPYKSWTAAILFMADAHFLKETQFVLLYDKVLPLITRDDTRSALWGRFLRVRAEEAERLQETVEECSTQLTEHNFREFTARFVEELLLSEGEVRFDDMSDSPGQPYRSTLIHLIRSGAGEEHSASGILCKTIRSQAFKEFGEERTANWSATEDDSQLLKVWVLRSLLPLMPGLPVDWLLGILNKTVLSPRSLDRGSRLGPPDGRDQLVAMLLITCTSQEDSLHEDRILRGLCRSLITSADDAGVVDRALRNLKERFAEAGAIAHISSTDHSSEEEEVLRRTRLFFKQRTGTVARIRESLNQQFFTVIGDR